MKVEGVEDIHNMHVWNINNEKIAMVAHIRAKNEYHDDILKEAKKLCLEYKIGTMTI